MRKKKSASAIFILFIAFFGIVVAYHASIIDFQRLYAENKIDNWSERLIAQEGVGRFCGIINYLDINRVFDFMGKKRMDKETVSRFIDSPVRCWKDMELIEMSYYAKYNVVSGVYRCEKENMIQELQLAIYLEPKFTKTDADCIVGTFPKDWNLPVGSATMFFIP